MKTQTFKTLSLLTVLVGIASSDLRAQPVGTNITPTQIHRAVQINWPGTDGAQYQVYSSTNLTQWEPFGEPLIGIGGTANSVTFVTDALITEYFQVSELPTLATNRFISLQDIDWSAATITTDTNGISLANLRVQSTNISLADYVTANFLFDMQHQAFQLGGYIVSPGVGVYNDPFFAEDNTNAIYLYQTTNQLMQSATSYSITSSGSAYYMDLTTGQAISFLLQNPTVDYTFEFLDPSGNSLDTEIDSANQGVITGTLPILKSGRYTVKFIPYNTSATSVTLDVEFMNANGRLLTPIVNGSVLNLTFATNLRDYAKFQVNLETNQLLSLEDPSDSNISLELLNSSSKNVDHVFGLPFTYQPESPGTFYLFIYNQNGWGSSYYSPVTITTVSNAPMIKNQPHKAANSPSFSASRTGGAKQ